MADPELERMLQAQAAAINRMLERLRALEKAVAEIRSLQGLPPSTLPAPSSIPPPIPTEAGPGRVPAPRGPAEAPAIPSMEEPKPPAPEVAPPVLVPLEAAAPTARPAPEAAAEAVEMPTVAAPEPPPIPVFEPAPAGAPAPEVAVPPAAPKPARSLEQVIGTKWMLIAGVVVLLIAGIYFFRYALEQGWITPMRRLIVGTLWGLVMIAGGQIAIRRKMRLFAAGLIGVGIGWLYQVVYMASPNGWDDKLHAIGAPTAFVWMCVVTALGIALSVQTRMMLAAIVSLAGAIATPMLLSTGENRQVLLMCYLLAVDSGFLILAYFKRWQVLAPMALAGTAVLFGAWFYRHYYGYPPGESALGSTTMFAWALAAVHAAWAIAAQARRRSASELAAAVFLAAAGLLIVLLPFSCHLDAQRHAFAIQLLAATCGLTAYALWRANQTILMAAYVAALVMLFGWFEAYRTDDMVAANCTYAWLLAIFPAAAIFLARSRDWVRAQTAMVALWGVTMVAVLLAACVYPAQRHTLGPQLLAAAAMVYAFALWRRIPGLAAATFPAALLVTWGWFLGYDSESAAAACAYAWALVLLPLAAITLRREGVWAEINVLQLAMAGAGMVAGWMSLGRNLPPEGLAWQLLVLNVLVLAICQWRRWHWLRAGLVVWTTIAMLVQYIAWGVSFDFFRFVTAGRPAIDMTWFTTGWAWAFYGLLIADVLVRAWKRSIQTREVLDAALTFIASAAMFGGTYALLDGRYHAWMGLYTALLAAFIVVLVLATYLWAGRKVLANAFLVQGLVLFALAAPIQWDRSAVTIAWTCQGTAAMLLAVWLRNRILLVDSPVVLGAALIQFLARELPTDGAIFRTVAEPLGVPITAAMLLAVMITAGLLVCAAALRIGRIVFSDRDDRLLAIVMVLVAAVFFAARTAMELPRVGATWWWLALAAGMGAVALARTSKWLSAAAMALLGAAALKWAFYDTLAPFLTSPAGQSSDGRAVALNWQFAAGVVLAIVMLVYEKLLRRRGLAVPRQWSVPFFLTAALLTAWGGSFEIHRFFHAPGAPGWIDAYKGTQMSLSLWWGLYAAVVLALGFIYAKPSLRYLAMALFAVTVGKAFFVDLGHIDMIYRVLALLGLGVLLLAGSLLYHRQMRTKNS